MARQIIGVIVGVLAGVLVISLIQMVGHNIYPISNIVDMSDPTVKAYDYMKNLPVGSLLMVLVSYISGAFMSGLVSTFVGEVNHIKLGVICGVILLLAIIMTIFSIPHPIWFMVASLVLTVPMALLGAKLAIKK